MFFRKRETEEPHKGDVTLAKGIYLKQTDMKNGTVLKNCFLRGLVVFLLAFGCVGSFLSCFAVSYNFVFVVAVFLCMAFYFSFLYSLNKLIYRDIGYIIFFILFVIMIGMFRLYANSGLYSVVNQILLQAQSFFELSGIRQYEVTIENSYETVAILAAFIGTVLIIILNIWISSSMSVIWTVGMTFPLLIIPLYMKLMPDFSYVICLIAGYIGVLIFKANGHYMCGTKGGAFKVRGYRKDKLVYTQDEKSFSQILLSVFFSVFCVVIVVGNLFPAGVFEEQFQEDKLRANTKDSIGNFLLLGFSGLYNQYGSTGGLAEGKLGGISNVRTDYQTDLIIDYAPYSAEPVYLKGYTGGIYGENEWISIYEGGLNGEYADWSDTEIFVEESMKQEATDRMLAFAKDTYGAMGKMSICNVGANSAYLYYPYYTMFESYERNTSTPFRSQLGISLNETVEYEYYPNQDFQKEYMDVTAEAMDCSGINDIYLDVPEKNQEVIKEISKEMGITTQMSVREIVDIVSLYFEENIPYTLKPGATPKEEDFVNYFLTKNRKGYCAHFASAATLLFREAGIPARYVEGYAFSFENALASDERTDLKYDEYFKGYSSIGASTVLEVEVTDAMAHAWVEIYVDGFGWMPVEVTPGSNEIVDEDDFWSAFSSMLQDASLDGGNRGGADFGNLNLSQYKGLVNLVGIAIGMVILFFVTKWMVRKMGRFAKCHQRNRKEAVVAFYAQLCESLRMLNREFCGCKSHQEQLDYMKQRGMTDGNVKELARMLECISYSEKEIPKPVLTDITKQLQSIRKRIWKLASWKQKIQLFRR